MPHLRLIVAILIALTTVPGLTGCSTNPATGKKQLNALSESEERSLGAEAAPKFVEQYGGDIPSAEIQQYVSNLGHQLAAVSERPDLDWEFHAVNSSVINAFALPGGKVFITRGLMVKLGNEAQLAGVLGHEIGHVTAQHIGQQMTRAAIITGIGVGIGVAGEKTDKDWMKVLGVGTSVGGGVYMLSFGRDQETQADELGLRYMTRLGYNPIGQIQVMKVLKRAAGGGGGLEILSTHPLARDTHQAPQRLRQEKLPRLQRPPEIPHLSRPVSAQRDRRPENTAPAEERRIGARRNDE